MVTRHSSSKFLFTDTPETVERPYTPNQLSPNVVALRCCADETAIIYAKLLDITVTEHDGRRLMWAEIKRIAGNESLATFDEMSVGDWIDFESTQAIAWERDWPQG